MSLSNNGLAIIKSLKSAATIQYHADQGGLDLIEGQEGLRLHAYLDSAGVPTIGWGSTRYANGAPVKMGDVLPSKADADKLLLVTLKGYEADIDRVIRVPLTQDQFDALLSLHYNTGCLTQSVCTLRDELNAGHYMAAAAQFLVWNKSRDRQTGLRVVNPVLVQRRKIEYNLFTKDIKQTS